jgi:hypothetical protein
MGREMTNALIVPVDAALITKDTIDQAYEFYRDLAVESLEGAAFKSADERDAEIARVILQLVESTDAINDNVRQRAIGVIARYKLYHHAPEGWGTLTEMIRDAAPGLSPSQLSEHLSIAEIVAPYCEGHGIELEMPPERLGYLREAASGLRHVIQGPLPNGEKAEAVEGELEWLFTKANTRREVRDRYRDYRGTPGKGISGEQDGMTVIVIHATAATAAALRQKAGRLVTWDMPGTLTIRAESGAMVPSKLDNGEYVQDQATIITVHQALIIDGETGAIVDG